MESIRLFKDVYKNFGKREMYNSNPLFKCIVLIWCVAVVWELRLGRYIKEKRKTSREEEN